MPEDTNAESVDPIETQDDNEQKKLEIGVEVSDAGKLKKKITVTIPREQIDAKTNEMFGELSSTAQIPGFRVGRAPRRLIEKRFGKEINDDVRNAILGESIGQAIEQAELNTLGEPDIDLDAIELPETGDLSFDFEVEVKPDFKLPKLEGIKIEKRLLEIDDSRVDQMLETWQQGQAKYEPAEKAAEAGDMVTAGATITGDGIEENRPGLQLRVAAGQIEGIPLVELADALTGKKAGDTAEVTVTIPEAHPNEDWQNKEVKIAIEISQVSQRVLPELNAEFAQQHGYETVEELREQIRLNLVSRVDTDVQRDMRDQISQYLIDNTKFDLPEGMVTRHTGSIVQRRYVDLLYRGVPREQIDENITELQAAASEMAEREMQLLFVMDKVAEDQELEVTGEEVNSRIAEMAHANNRRPERLRQELAANGTLGQVHQAILEEKALDRLLEKAEITEVKAEDAKPQEKAEKKAKKTKKAKKAAESDEKADAPAKAEKKAEKKSAKKTTEEKASKKSE